MAAARSTSPAPGPSLALIRRMARHPFVRSSNGGCSKRHLRPDFLKASRAYSTRFPTRVNVNVNRHEAAPPLSVCLAVSRHRGGCPVPCCAITDRRAGCAAGAGSRCRYGGRGPECRPAGSHRLNTIISDRAFRPCGPLITPTRIAGLLAALRRAWHLACATVRQTCWPALYGALT